MWLIKRFKKKKLILLNIFLTLYVGINFIGGERGLIAYFEKKNIYKELTQKEINLSKNLQNLENRIKLIHNNDFLIF